MPLTELECKRASCPASKPFARLADAHGMYLEVTQAGGRYWRMKYRYAGKEKRLALGVYPAVSLADARRARDKARAVLADGVDPGQQRKEAKLARALKVANTFEVLAMHWWEHWRPGKTPRHADYVLRRLRADVLPLIGDSPAADVTAAHLLAMAKRIETRGAVDIAKRSLQTCGQILRYGVVHNLIERNPAADVRPSDALQSRRKENYARLDVRDVPELLRKIEVYPGAPATRLAMKLMALTFVRTGELIAARWSEFDFQGAEWRLPAERMKMRSPHIVPLAPQALEVLGLLQSINGGRDLLFPGERDHTKPMSNMTILAALYRMGYRGRMTGHGFRGIASTALHEAGFDHRIIELQLAHSERDEVSAAYNHATHLAARRKMMVWWANKIDALRESGNVAVLRKAA